MNNFIKLTIVAIFSVILAMPAEAKRVEPEKAKKLAQNFVESKRGPWVKADIRLKHTAKKRKQKHEKEETALYYVFNVNEAQGSGFVIVAGDDAVKAVLGYSDSGNYDENNVPTNFAYWMDFLGEQIAYAQEQELAYSGQYSGQYDHDYGQPNGWVAVSPLIQTQWNQSAPYNNKTPVHSGQQTVTGCVATAMAQIMKYWNHPMKGTGSSTAYTTTTNSISVPSVNFAATTYDWSNMLDKYSSTATTPQNDAVATLMYHAGVSVQMDYGQSSGAQNARIAPALRDNFGYDNSIQQLFRSNYSNTAWDAMLEAEIDAGRPVYYAGSNANEGHAFILDGYDNTDKFHFNWGWGGKYDGYFVTTALNPGTGGIGAGAGTYNLNQTIIINIKPKNANAPPTITSPPSNRTVQAGNTAQFTVAATPTGALSYQWQVSKNTVATRDTIVREDFEGTNSFTVINGTQTNKWHVGTAAVYGGTKSAYISNNNGTSNALTATSSIVHMYKDVTFPVFEACTLWLYRKGKADANNNYLSIRLVETSVTPTAGSTPGGAYNYFTTSYDNWVLSYYVVPQSNSGTTKRLVFTWQNDGSGINPPIAMDNILMIATVLESGESPFSNVSDGTGGTTATYTTPTATRAMSGYRYRSIVKSNNGLPATSQIATLTVTGAITGHPSNRTVNAGEQAQFTTTAAPSGVTYQWQVSKNIVEAKETLVDENFEGSSSSFTLVNGSQTNQWAIGTAAAYGGTKSAYISNNNGTSNALTTTSSIVHMYKDVTFPVFEACTLWFYRKGKADANNNLTLRLVETSVTPTAGSTPSGTYQNFNSNQDNWSRAYYVVPQSNSGTTKRLVLTWKNDNTGANPPYAIDNILIVATVLIPGEGPFSNVSDGTGSTAATYTTPTTTKAMSGYRYRSIVSSGGVPLDTSNIATLTVNKANPTVTWPTAAAITYGAALSTSVLSGGASTPAGTFAWTTGTTVPTVTNSGYSVTFTPTDTANYNTRTQNVAITVNKANPTVTTWPTAAAINSGAALSTSVLSGGAATPAGTFAWTNGATVPTVTNSGYSVTFTPTDAANYNTLTQTVAITVISPTPTITTQPSNQSITYGNTAQFTVSASLNGASSLTYQWQESSSPPIFSEDFEGTNSFTVVNGTETNKWYVGTATAATGGGTKSAYISNDNGASNAYNTTSESTVHMYKDITFPSGSQQYILTFDWKGQGEGTTTKYDYLRVFLVETSVTPAAGTQLTQTSLGTYNLQGSWQKATVNIPTTNNGTTKRLVFSWRNDASSGTPPPIAVDNIMIGVSGSVPFANVSTGTGGTSATYTTPTATMAMSGNAYRCIVTNNYGQATASNYATLTVSTIAPTITTQPSNQSITYGSTAQFTVAAALNGASSLTYQWQESSFPLSISEDFEGEANSFTIVNGSETNKWVVGTATAATGGGTKSAYISNDNGTSNAYNTSETSVVHMYKDITFPSGSQQYILTFDWKGQGEYNYDFLRVSLVETSVTPAADTLLTQTALGTYNLQGSWQKATVNIPTTNNGTTKRLVFSWRNDNLYGTQPPIAVDNIMINFSSNVSFANVSTGTGGTSATYTPVATVAKSGYAYRCIVTNNYGQSTTSNYATLTVNKATPTVTWPTAAAITYGAALSTSALSGGAGAGTFAWTTGTTVPTVANSGYSVTFTPTDAANYNTRTQNVAITVNKANPTVTTWPTAAAINYGAALSTSALSGGASTPAGTFAWTTGTTVPTVTNSGYSVTFTPTDVANYNTRTQNVAITVIPPTPTITTQPSNQSITYGSTAQFTVAAALNGASSQTYQWQESSSPPIFSEDFEGTNSFTVVNGTETNKWYVGTATAATGGGTKSAYISNDNGASNAYNITSSSVVHMYKDITFPSGSQQYILTFDWKGQGEGTTTKYDYLRVFLVETSVTPAAGTELSGTALGTYNLQGSWQKATVNIPTSNNGTAKRLVFSWKNDNNSGTPPPIAVDNIIIVPFANVSTGTGGTSATYTPAATVAKSGYAYRCIVTNNYGQATASDYATLTVNKANPTVTTWPTAAAINYGAALSTSALSGGASTPAGTFAWTNGTTVPTVTNSGYSVTFTPTDAANYNTLTQNVAITVNKTNSIVTTWPTAAAITYGAALSTSALSGGASTQAGTFAWTNGTTVPTVTNSGYSVTFTPTDAANYNTVTQTVAITVNKANPTATFPTSATITYGQTLADAVFTGGSGTGTFKFTESTTTLMVAQSSTQHEVTFTPTDAANYNTRAQNVAVTVNKATGLQNTAPPTIQISASNTDTRTYDLNSLALNKSDHGTRGYSLAGALAGSDPTILASISLGADGHTLSYKGNGKISGNATQAITITSQNYANITATITFEATAKTDVAITGLTKQNYTYDGTPKSGYTGAASAPPYAGSFVYEYAGTGIDGITTDKPTNAGDYILRVTIPPDALYIGAARIEFTIAKAKITKPTVTNTNLVYTGSEQSAGIAANTAYTITGDKGTNVNSYTATVALKDKANREWADGEDDDLLLNWAIAKATPAPATPINLTATVGQTLADIALPAGWEWHNPTASVGTAGQQKHSARHTPSDTENYHVLTAVELSIQVMNAVNPIIPQIAIGNIRVQATGNVIMLENLPRNTKVQVYTLQGKQIYSANSENSIILRIPVQTEGMYIVKVGSQTIRAVVR